MGRTWITDERAKELFNEISEEEENELDLFCEAFESSKEFFKSLNPDINNPYYSDDMFQLVTMGFIFSNAFVLPFRSMNISKKVKQHFQDVRSYANSILYTISKAQLDELINEFSVDYIFKTHVAIVTNTLDDDEDDDRIEIIKNLIMTVHYLESLVSLRSEHENLKDKNDLPPELIYGSVLLRYYYNFLESNLTTLYPVFQFIQVIEIATHALLPTFHRLFVKIVAKIFKTKTSDLNTDDAKKIRLFLEKEMSKKLVNEFIDEAEHGDWS